MPYLDSSNVTDLVADIKALADETYADINHTHSSDSSKLDASLKGAANGVAELDSSGKVPTSQLPAYVDDVLEYTNKASFPATGETGKIYVDKATNLTYRWSGSAYVEISPSLALGTTSSTAFRGDYGNAAYAHAVTNKGSAFTSGLYKITTNSEGHVTAAAAVAKSDITALGIPSENTTYTNSDFGIGYGICQTAAATAEKAVNISSGFKRSSGAIFSVKFTYGMPANGTLNVNNTGAVPVYYLGSAITANVIEAGDFVTFVFSGAYYHVVAFDKLKPKKIGQGIRECETPYATAAKVVDIPGFELRTGGIVVVYFYYDVGANATLNVSGTGAKALYYGADALPDGVIKAGDMATFIYDGTGYTLLAIDNTIDIRKNVSLGHGYGTCSTAASTSVKVVDLPGFKLVDGAAFAVKFDNDVPATAQMNVNNTGAAYIYYKGWTIDGDLIQADDTVTFIYDGEHYCVLAIDRMIDNAEHIALIADYIGADELQTTAQTLAGAINEINSGKIDKVSGKGLSTNDYTTTEKNKLSGIAAGAEVNVQANWNETSSSSDAYILNKPQNLVQDASYVHTDNNYTTTEKTKLSSIAEGAEVNQNAFSNVKVGSTTIAADGKTDTLELVAGSNISLTPDATNDKVTIGAVGNYGVCDTAGSVQTKEVTIDGLTVTTGTTIHVCFTNANSASDPLLSVNGGTAIGMVQYGTTVIGTSNKTTGWIAGSVVSLTYNGTYWVRDQGYNTNDTYSNASLGNGKGTCTPTEGSTALTVALSSYALTTGGRVTILFFGDVPANATLNINSKGAKAIMAKGANGIAAITDGVIENGDTATFIYDGSFYQLLSIDRIGLITVPSIDTRLASVETSVSNVETSVSGKVSKSGDTMTGDLSFAEGKKLVFNYQGSTSLETPAFTVSEQVNGFNGSGTNVYPRLSFTNSLNQNGVRLYGIANPSESSEAANKDYVDTQVASASNSISTFLGSSDSLNTEAQTVVGGINEVEAYCEDIEENLILKVTISSLSSLPRTVSWNAITASHEVISYNLGTPTAQTGTWTITTAAGSVTISGNISGSTTLTLYLAKPRQFYTSS